MARSLNERSGSASRPQSGLQRSKEEAGYEVAGGSESERCGNCRSFGAPNSCLKVRGPVSSQDWCELWEPEPASNVIAEMLFGGN
jgi:hypothetical protein